MKKILAFLMTFLFLFSVLPVWAEGDSGLTDEDGNLIQTTKYDYGDHEVQ